MKNRDFSMPSIYTCKLCEVSRGVFKKTHSGGGFFWRGFLVVLRKLLSNFHRKFAILEKPRFLLASVNGTIVCCTWFILCCVVLGLCYAYT